MKTLEKSYPVNLSNLLNKIRQQISSYFSDDRCDYSHCFQHTERVVGLARYICKHEDGDIIVVSLSALLHDIARSMEERGECSDHSEKGAELAKQILESWKISSEQIEKVAYCIKNHRTDKVGTTLEAKILKDADKLDSLGAICISRVIASSLQSNQYHRPIFNPSISLDGHETASALHYLILLLQRYQTGNYFFTRTAKNLARERVKVMEEFVEQFKREWFFN